MSALGGGSADIIDHLRRYSSTQRKGNRMSANDTYLAIFLGSKTSAKMMAWNSLPEAERGEKEREEIAAWKAWVEKHQRARSSPWVDRSAKPRRSLSAESKT